MARNSVNDYSTTAGDNTDIQSINIGEGCAPSNINNAIRQQMAHIASLVQGGITATSIKAAALTAQTATFTAALIGTYTAVSTARQVLGGAGLTAGGALSSDVTLALDVSDLTATSTVVTSTDYVPVYIDAATATYKVLLDDIAPAASYTVPGIAELATTTEVQALSDTGRVVTPAGLAAVGFMELLTTITTNSGTSQTYIDIPKCRALFVVFSGVSSSSTATMQMSVSDDNGSNYGTARDVGIPSVSSGYFNHIQVWISGTGLTATNKRIHSVAGSPAGGNAAVNTEVESTRTGVTNALRFNPSAGSFDAGTIYVYGWR